MAVREAPVAGSGCALCVAAVLRGIGMVLAIPLGVGWGAGIAAEPAAAQSMRHHATVLNGGVAGSGFAIAADRVVTNAHVVLGLTPGAMLVLVASSAASDGSRAQVLGRVLAISERMDLALLSVPTGFLPGVDPVDAPRHPGLVLRAAGVDAGDAAGALPRMELAGQLMAARPEATPFGPGLIARLPGVRPGFSGGPVLDEAGRLVGMIAAIRPVTRGEAPRGDAQRVRIHRPAGADEALILPAEVIRAEAARLESLSR